jgi:hypothetical protein
MIGQVLHAQGPFFYVEWRYEVQNYMAERNICFQRVGFDSSPVLYFWLSVVFSSFPSVVPWNMLWLPWYITIIHFDAMKPIQLEKYCCSEYGLEMPYITRG